MKRIFVCGNALLDLDNLPLRIKPRLEHRFPKIEFLELEPTENFPESDHLEIIDTVQGIDEAKIITDIDLLHYKHRVSLHDSDLGFNLKFHNKFGQLKSVRIIGIPMQISEDEAFTQTEKIIASLF